MAQGTRGKQQEEQMATVLAVLREQGERQDRLAEEQRVLHEQLSRQFGEQVQQLAWTQECSWEQQQLVEPRLVELEGERKATRETTFQHLEAVEKTLF